MCIRDRLISMHLSPKIAVVTNVTPNHLDHHKDMQEYIDAKRNILLYQNPVSYTHLRNTAPKGLKDGHLTGGVATAPQLLADGAGLPLGLRPVSYTHLSRRAFSMRGPVAPISTRSLTWAVISGASGS